MDKKGAIELSANFLVILIIAISVFGMGLRMTYKLITKAEEIREDVDESTQREIEEALTTGEIVSIPLNRKKTGTGKSVIFGLGIFNSESTQEFTINMNFEKAFSNDKEEITYIVENSEDEWIQTTFGPYEINKNENRVVGLPVRVPKKSGGEKTPSGTYIFKVEVSKGDGSRYGNLQKAYVEVD